MSWYLPRTSVRESSRLLLILAQVRGHVLCNASPSPPCLYLRGYLSSPIGRFRELRGQAGRNSEKLAAHTAGCFQHRLLSSCHRHLHSSRIFHKEYELFSRRPFDVFNHSGAYPGIIICCALSCTECEEMDTPASDNHRLSRFSFVSHTM